MSMSMYQASVPMLVQSLKNLDHILDKAVAYCEAKSLDPAVLLNCRLFPDMFPLVRQVQIATDIAKGCVARLSGMEPPSWEDTETSFEELKARLEKAIAYLKEFTPEQIDGTEEKEVTLQLRSGPLQFSGQDYLRFFVLPNVSFHVTTAYNILRHNGVELGKKDYLGGR